MAALNSFYGGVIMRENLKVQLCPMCETGRKGYWLDSSSTFCSHISCLKDGKCNCFVPLKNNKNNE